MQRTRHCGCWECESNANAAFTTDVRAIVFWGVVTYTRCEAKFPDGWAGYNNSRDMRCAAVQYARGGLCTVRCVMPNGIEVRITVHVLFCDPQSASPPKSGCASPSHLQSPPSSREYPPHTPHRRRSRSSLSLLSHPPGRPICAPYGVQYCTTATVGPTCTCPAQHAKTMYVTALQTVLYGMEFDASHNRAERSLLYLTVTVARRQSCRRRVRSPHSPALYHPHHGTPRRASNWKINLCTACFWCMLTCCRTCQTKRSL